KENFDIIHCNTPVGGLLGRICGKLTKVPIIIYSAHGFHFYKGANRINNFLYENAEKTLAKYTDAIITMNEEDYRAAEKFKLKENGNVYKINGVGVNTTDYQGVIKDKASYKKTLNIPSNSTVLISMGDLISRKNYDVSIK